MTSQLNVDECDDATYRPMAVPWTVLRREARLLRRPCVGDVAARPPIDTQRAEQFKALVKQWKRDTTIRGHLSKIVMHPAYQRIMAMGPDAIPLILREMASESGHWFWALHNLVPPGKDPAEGATTISSARRAWLDWGKKEGIL